MFLQAHKDGSAVDLLNNEAVTLQPRSQPAVVCLVRPVHIPAYHGRLVDVTCDSTLVKDDTLFESAREDLAKQGLSIEDGVIKARNDATFTIEVHNCNSIPVDLMTDQILGNIVPDTTIVETAVVELKGVHVVTREDENENIDSHINAIRVDSDQERIAAIQTMLSVEKLEITSEEKMNLSELIEEFEDVFALNPTELGRTNVVEHRIDTGNSAPLIQPPRRVPFALKAKVDELVNEMMKQGVVQPSTSPWSSPIVLVAKKDGSTWFCVAD
jgi:hypothetical protein